MVKTKIDTYIGFAIRSNKVAFGSDSIKTLKKGIYLIVLCASAAKNITKLAYKFSDEFSCPLVLCKSGLKNVVFRDNCKIIAIKDENLAKAVVEHIDENYEIMLGGNN